MHKSCIICCVSKRAQGSRGLTLVTPFLPQIFLTMAASSLCPLSCRAENDTICSRRCPLFDRDIGSTLNTAVTLDLLHTKPIWARCCWITRHVVLGILAQRHLGTSCIAQNAVRVSKRLSHRNENLTQLSDATPSLVNSLEEPKLETKSADTWGMLLLFLAHCLRLRDKPFGLKDVELSVCANTMRHQNSTVP